MSFGYSIRVHWLDAYLLVDGRLALLLKKPVEMRESGREREGGREGEREGERLQEAMGGSDKTQRNLRKR